MAREVRRKDNKGRVLKKGESQRKDLTYMYRYTDVSGQRQCIYAPTLTELRDKEVQIEKDLLDGIHSANIILNDLVYRYLEKNQRIKERTRFKYKTEYDRWVGSKWLGKKKLKDIRTSDIKTFYKELKDDGYSDGTIRCVHKYIHGAMDIAVEDDMIRRNYSDGCTDLYSSSETEIMPLTKEQTSNFLKTAESVHFGQMYLLGFKLMLYTGMRIGETTGLTWDDIDFKNRVIHVDHQFVQGDSNSRTSYHIDGPKTFTGIRDVPMSDDVYELLVELKKDTYESAYKWGAQVDGYKGFVIHSRTGLPIYSGRFNEYYKKIIKIFNDSCDNEKDKLPNVTNHVCRHTFCTRMAEMKLSPMALKKMVGHKSYKTTLDIYISVDDNFVNEDFYRAMRGEI